MGNYEGIESIIFGHFGVLSFLLTQKPRLHEQPKDTNSPIAICATRLLRVLSDLLEELQRTN
jgi:hypothetical protein